MPEMATFLGIGEVGEVTSIAGGAVSQIINTVRTIVAYILEIIRRIYQWAGEHPLAFTLSLVNLLILLV